MNRWIERTLYRCLGWWRFKRRWHRLQQYQLNAFCAEQLRVLVSEPNRDGDHQVYVERLGRDQQWRRIAALGEEELAALTRLFVDAHHFLRPAAARWKLVSR